MPSPPPPPPPLLGSTPTSSAATSVGVSIASNTRRQVETQRQSVPQQPPSRTTTTTRRQSVTQQRPCVSTSSSSTSTSHDDGTLIFHRWSDVRRQDGYGVRGDEISRTAALQYLNELSISYQSNRRQFYDAICRGNSGSGGRSNPYGFFVSLIVEFALDEEVLLATNNVGFVDPPVLRDVGWTLRDNTTFVMQMVQRSGMNLQFCSGRLLADPQICLQAVSENPYSFKYCSQELRADPTFMIQAVQINGVFLQHAKSFAIKDDVDIATKAVRQNGLALNFVSSRLQSFRPLVRLAVQQNGKALKFANTVLQNDYEIVHTSVRRYGKAIEYASSALQQNREILVCSELQRLRLPPTTKLLDPQGALSLFPHYFERAGLNMESPTAIFYCFKNRIELIPQKS